VEILLLAGSAGVPGKNVLSFQLAKALKRHIHKSIGYCSMASSTVLHSALPLPLLFDGLH
jgi:hypothetical protein